jgi:hypothetical protein
MRVDDKLEFVTLRGQSERGRSPSEFVAYGLPWCKTIHRDANPHLNDFEAVLHRYLIFPLSLLALAACGRAPEARANTSRSDSIRCDGAAGVVTTQSQSSTKPDSPAVTDSTATVRDTARDSTAVSRDTATDSTVVRPDSVKESPKEPAIEVRVAPGRSKKDSLALVYAVRAGNKQPGWPVKGPTPAPCAIIPQKRIVAFYGNPLSKRMGILGEIPPEKMLAKLDTIVGQWNEADPATPVQPALHYIAVVASGDSGMDGKWRTRMDSSMIEQVYGWAQQHKAILFLDIQTGQSTIQAELPRLMKFLRRPDVHLGIDPEFHMHYTQEGVPPGKKIGTLSAKEVNWAIEQLANVVTEKKLPPKVLVVHRFTRPMLRNADQIKLDPRVQVVVNMDGWGAPWLKYDSYKAYVVSQPVQFTGFKLFFRNDTKRGDKLLTPMEVLQLKPVPIYIQYQ